MDSSETNFQRTVLNNSGSSKFNSNAIRILNNNYGVFGLLYCAKFEFGMKWILSQLSRQQLLGRQRNIRATSTAVQIKRDGDCCRYRNDKDSICSMKNLA
jgi:hypothetical protein